MDTGYLQRVRTPLSPMINNPRRPSMGALSTINRPLIGGAINSGDNLGNAFRRPTPQLMTGASVGGFGGQLGQSRLPLTVTQTPTIGRNNAILLQLLQKRSQ